MISYQQVIDLFQHIALKESHNWLKLIYALTSARVIGQTPKYNPSFPIYKLLPLQWELMFQQESLNFKIAQVHPGLANTKDLQ